MGTGLDTQFGAAKETNYGERVVPTRFFEIEPTIGGNFERQHYQSQGLGGGRWRRKRVQTTRRGATDWSIEVPTSTFGFWLDLLHNATPAVTPVGGSGSGSGSGSGDDELYLQTHPLATPPRKSATVQIGIPQIGSTVSPFDYIGVTVRGIRFSWEPGEVLKASLMVLIKDEETNNSLAVPSLAETGMFSFRGGEIRLDGAPVAHVHGGGNIGFEWPMRDDAYALGGDGTISKPLENERPAATGEFTADFDSMTHYNRVVNDELADLALEFEGDNGERITILSPDQSFNQTAPQVEGAGPVTQTVSLEAASPTGAYPTIEYVSTDNAV
jgi:hypothetical protein